MNRLARDIALMGIACPSIASANDNTLSPAAMGALAAAIGVPLTLALLRKVKGYQYRPSGQPIGAAAEGKYRRWNSVTGLMVLAYAGVIGAALWLAFVRIEALIAAELGPADFVLTPIPIFFGLPALFAGILLSALPLRWTLKALLGKDGYQGLLEYSDRKHQMNSTAMFRHMAYVGTVLIVLSVLLAWRAYAVVTPDGMVVHPYFALHARSYHWLDVRRITLVKSFTTPNGSVHHRAYYRIETADGGGINFRQSVLEAPFPKQRELAKYIAAHAGMGIDIEDPFPL